jgi:hypothetical protein
VHVYAGLRIILVHVCAGLRVGINAFNQVNIPAAAAGLFCLHVGECHQTTYLRFKVKVQGTGNNVTFRSRWLSKGTVREIRVRVRVRVTTKSDIVAIDE